MFYQHNDDNTKIQSNNRRKMFYQDEDEFLELVPLSDVSDDVAARRVRTAVENKDVRPLILKRRKEGTEIDNKIYWRKMLMLQLLSIILYCIY